MVDAASQASKTSATHVQKKSQAASLRPKPSIRGSFRQGSCSGKSSWDATARHPIAWEVLARRETESKMVNRPGPNPSDGLIEAMVDCASPRRLHMLQFVIRMHRDNRQREHQSAHEVPWYDLVGIQTRVAYTLWLPMSARRKPFFIIQLALVMHKACPSLKLLCVDQQLRLTSFIKPFWPMLRRQK